MEISPALMAKMLLFSFLFGVVSGAVFDVGRAFRTLIFGYPKSKKMHKFCQIKLPFSRKTICGKNRFFKAFLHIVIFFSDLLFVVFFACGLILVNYFFNDGGLRGFTFWGAILGFALYYFTLSHLLIFIFEGVIIAARYLVWSIFDLLRLPFLFIYNNFEKNIKKIYEKFRFRLEKRSKKVYNVCELLCEDRLDNNKRIRIRPSKTENQRRECKENEKDKNRTRYIAQEKQ